MILSPFLRIRPLVASVAALLVLPALPALSATLVWNNVTGNWSAGSNWTPAGPPTGDPTDVLVFGGDVGTVGVPTTYTATNDIAGTLQINQLNFNATGGDGSRPAHLLGTPLAPGNPVRLTGTNPQVSASGAGAVVVNLPVQLGTNVAWNGDGAGVLTFNGTLSGTANIVKSGTSTFRFGTLIDGTPSGNTWMGSLAIDAGVVRFNNNAFSGPTALRANPVTLNAATPAGALLIVQPNAADDFDAGMRLGTISGTNGTVQARKELSGADQINFNSGSLLITAMTDGSFGGTVRNAKVGIGSLNDARFTVRGEGTQSFTGTVDIAKDVFIGGRATLVLAGTASLASQTTGAIVLAGGNFRLDNTAGNVNRLRDNNATGLDTNGGGTFTLVGNSAGTTENVAQLQLGATKARAGVMSVQVQHNPAAGAPTVLQFSNLNRNNSEFTSNFLKPWLNEFATVDFSATGGTLGAAGNQPQIKFTSSPPVQATGGLLRNTEGTALDASVGWATANGDSFATYDTTTGIKPVATVAFPAASSPGVNALLDTDGTISGASAFTLNSLKIQPGAAGQSLSITGNGNLDTTALLLAGANSFTIANNGGTGGLGGNDTRYVHVQNAGTTLTINVQVDGSGVRPLVKSGAGTLALGSSGNGLVPTIINAGTLRAEPGVSLPGGELRFRGGVLEIVGGSFNRALGNTGGTVSWSGFDPEDNGGLGAGIDEDRGSGGFAAFGSDPSLDAIVDLNVLGPTNFSWEDRFFVNSGYALMFGSPLANRRVVWVDNIGLAEAGTTQNYNAREFRVIDNPSVTTDSVRLTGTISGTVQNDLLKTGDGLLELTGTNSYAGATIIHQGQMVINGSIIQSFLTDVHATALLAGGQTTAGTGSVGAVRVQNGGTVAPGTAAGRTSILNARDIEFGGAAAKLSIEIGGVTAGGNGIDGYDQLNITGTVQLNGATLELAQLGGFTFVDGQIVFIVKNDGTDPINGTFAQGSFISFGGQMLEIGYGANAEGAPSFTGGNDIALRIPEPSSAIMLAAGALGLAGFRRRRSA